MECPTQLWQDRDEGKNGEGMLEISVAGCGIKIIRGETGNGILLGLTAAGCGIEKAYVEPSNEGEKTKFT